MLLYAHRGASADAPENTLAAFREAAAQGADGVELDLMLCATGEMVVCHDDRLDRLAGLPWRVTRSPWSKLAAVDVGSRLGFAPERIPRLEEVVEALPSTMGINIELKGGVAAARGLAQAVGRFIDRARLQDRVLVSSFNPFLLLQLASKWPALRRGFLVDPDRNFFVQSRLIAPRVGRYSVHPHFRACTEARLAEWHRRGLVVAAWTVDDDREARAAERLGVDLLITNRPRKVRQALVGQGLGSSGTIF